MQQDSLTPAAWPGLDHPAKVDRRQLFGTGSTVVSKGGETWEQTLGEGRPGQLTTKTTLAWTLRLRRVR